MLKVIDARIPDAVVREYSRPERYRKYIRISWVNTYLYCPYQFYLERVRGVRVEGTEEMRRGEKRHEALMIEHEERAEVEMSIEEALFLSRMNREAYRFREVPVIAPMGKYQIGGRMDEIIIFPESVLIVDDKPSSRAYPGEVMQVLTYAYAFRRRFSPSRKVEVKLRNHTSLEFLWEGSLEGREREVERILDEMYAMLKHGIIPEVRVAPRKCERCRFREVCDLRHRKP